MSAQRMMQALLATACAIGSAAVPAATPPVAPAERAAIEQLLATYTRAVSTKDQALFETLLLNTAIPFAYVPANSHPLADHAIEQYAGFRAAVFAGAPFAQRFEDVRIQQQGGVADVTLVFVNTTATGASRGWKSMQLVKVNGTWKIASEFFTDYSDGTSEGAAKSPPR